VWGQEVTVEKVEGSVLVPGTSTGVSSAIDWRVVLEHLTALLSTMRELRDLPGFWYYLGPSVRVRFEDFQGAFAALRAELRG
jgi:hypothetical protein